MSGLFSVDFLIFLKLNVLLTELLHANSIRLLLEANLCQLLLVHLHLVFRLSLGFLLGDQIAIKELSLVNFSVYLLFLLVDLALEDILLLHLDLHLGRLLILLNLFAVTLLSSLQSFFLDQVLLLTELPALFFSCPQINFLSLLVGLVLL